MRKKMTKKTNVRSVATGVGTPRTWFRSKGWFSFVGITATLLFVFNVKNYAQPSASWPGYRHDAGLSGRAQVDGPIIPELNWVKTIGLEKIQSPVVASDGTIIFTSRGDQFVYALFSNGSEKWRFSNKIPGGNSNETFSHPPTLGSDGTIYVGSHEGGFFAINSNGSLKWRAKVGGYVGTAANIDKSGNIYIAVDDAQLYVFNPAGSLLCIGSLDGEKPSNTPAIVSNGQVYVPAGNSIFVFNSSCERIARWILPSLGEVAWVVSSANGSMLYAGSRTNALVLALDAQTGKQVWSYSYDSHSGPPSQPALGPDGTIYFAGFDAGLLVALQSNGKEKWTHNQGSARYKTMPVVDASGDIFIVNEALGLAAFSPEKKLLWNLPNVQCKYSPAFGPDGTIYVPSLKKLYAVRHQPPFAIRLEFVSGDGQTGCIDSVLANPIVARVLDQYGEAFKGQPVRFRAIKGNGKPQDSTINTVGDGIASVLWQLGPELGSQQLEISSLHNGQPLNGSPDTVIAIAVGPKIDGASEVVFRPTAVKHASDTTYVIFNRSDCILTVDSLRLLVGTDFSIKTLTSNVQISPGGRLDVLLQFAPLSAGPKVDTLHIFSNDSARPKLAVILRGEATTRPEILVVPTSLAFGQVMSGNTVSLPIEIFNVGTAGLSITKFDFSDPAYSIDCTTPLQISPGESVKCAVSFSPKEERLYPGTLTIFSTDTNVIVALSGSGLLAPDIEVSPNPLIISNVCKDSSGIGLLTISNVGNKALNVDSLKSDNPAFTFEENGFSLAPGESKIIEVSFSPQKAKLDSATLLIFSNDPDEDPFAVKLRGEGIGPVIVLRPDPVAFEVCANESVVGVVNIINDSDCELRVDSVKFAIVPKGLFALQSANSYWQTAAAALVIPPHESLPFSFNFTAPTVNFEVRFRVRSSATNEDPATVIIPGTIKPPTIAADDSVQFGEVTVGTSKAMNAKAWAAFCQVRVDTAIIIGEDRLAFQLGSLTYPFTLNEGDTVNFSVSFHPKDLGDHTATLQVFSSDKTHNPIEIVLLGTGTPVPPPFPVIEVNPDSLAFGAQCDTAYRATVVKNVGDMVLAVTNLQFTNSAFFTNHAKSFQVQVGKSDTVWVGYTPIPNSTATGELLIISNAFNEDTVSVALSGEVGVPDIAGANGLIFKTVEVQTCADKTNSDKRTYWIKNTGTCTLEITSLLTSAPFAVTSPSTPQTIGRGDSLQVTLVFAPQVDSLYHGKLVIVSNDPDESSFEVALQGKGEFAPDINVTPTVLDFGPVAKDSTKWLPVTVHNWGSENLIIGEISFSNSPSAFATETREFSLKCKEDSVLMIAFTPKAMAFYQDTLWISNNDPDENSVWVVLKGNGTQGKQPEINVSPLALEFGTPCQDTSLYTVICNLGEGTLQISALTFTDPAFSTSHALPFNVAPGACDTVWVSYAPTAGVELNATLAITSNDSDEAVVSVKLHGRGGAPTINAPDALTFSDTKVDSARVNSLAVANPGACVLNIAMTITGLHPSDFKLMVNDSAAVNSGAAYQVGIEFKPTAPGLRQAVLVIKSNDPATQVKEVLLSGNGFGEALLDVVPDTLDFGDVTVNEKKSKIVYLKSVGRAAVSITGCSTSLPTIFASEYCARTDDDRVPIQPGQSDSMRVEFAPNAEQVFSGQLTIQSNDASGRPVVVYLRGRGVMGNLVVDPKPLPVPDICAGTTELIKGSLINQGPGNVYIYGPLQLASERDDRTRGFTILSPIFTQADTTWLEPHKPLAFVVEFSGVPSGTYRDTLLVATNLNPKPTPFPVALQGLAREEGARLVMNPPLLEFEGLLDEEFSKQVMIKNIGCETLMIDRLDLQRKDRVFQIKTDLKGVSLNSGDSVAVMVSFKGNLFEKFENKMLAYSNDSRNNPEDVLLEGEVKDGAICSVIKTRKLDFGELAVGRELSLKLVVGDTCKARIRVMPLPLEMKEYTVLPDTGFQLFPGQEQPFDVTFAPQSAGTFTTKLFLQVWTLDRPEEKQEEEIELTGKAIGVDEVVVRPNVITPNEDGRNDEAKFLFPEGKFEAPVVYIFSISGVRVNLLQWTNKNVNYISWNGRDENRQMLLPGPYLWIFEDQGKKIKSGNIAVIR